MRVVAGSLAKLRPSQQRVPDQRPHARKVTLKAYTDSSALVKLAVEEPGSAVLHAYVDAGTFELAPSALAIVEVARAVRVADLETSSRSTATVLDRLLLIDVDREILRIALSYTSARVRPLDAIHLASAMRTDARQMLVYDRRLAEAASAAGLEVVSPGA